MLKRKSDFSIETKLLISSPINQDQERSCVLANLGHNDNFVDAEAAGQRARVFNEHHSATRRPAFSFWSPAEMYNECVVSTG